MAKRDVPAGFHFVGKRNPDDISAKRNRRVRLHAKSYALAIRQFLDHLVQGLLGVDHLITRCPVRGVGEVLIQN